MSDLFQVVFLGVLAQVPAPEAPGQLARGLREAHSAILDKEAAELEAVATQLADSGRVADAAQIRRLIERPARGDGPQRFVPLPEFVLAADHADRPEFRAAPTSEAATARSRAAHTLLVLGRKAGGAQPPARALADECFRGVIRRDPNQAEARRVLGFVPFRGGWATPYAVSQISAGKIPHPKFGWVEAAWVPRLANGELPAPRTPGGPSVDRWLPAAEADALRARWSDGWRITTEHFQIQTNVPLSEAIAFGRQLEALHELFFAILADLIGPELPMGQRLKNPGLVPRLDSRRYRVNYFASKQDYLDVLVPRHGPDLAGSLGFYLPPKDARRIRESPTSSFFRDPNGQVPDSATLFHEASHQLLFESAGPDAHERNAGNYWIFEGLGTYFETLNFKPDGTLEIGGPIGPRLAEARRRIVNQSELVPTGRFVALGKERFNAREAIHLHYLEAIALATYLMQREGQRDRDAFLDYARDAYRGRLRTGGRPLADRLNTSYEAIDNGLAKYLREQVPPEDPR